MKPPQRLLIGGLCDVLANGVWVPIEFTYRRSPGAKPVLMLVEDGVWRDFESVDYVRIRLALERLGFACGRSDLRDAISLVAWENAE